VSLARCVAALARLSTGPELRTRRLAMRSRVLTREHACAERAQRELREVPMKALGLLSWAPCVPSRALLVPMKAHAVLRNGPGVPREETNVLSDAQALPMKRRCEPMERQGAPRRLHGADEMTRVLLSRTDGESQQRRGGARPRPVQEFNALLRTARAHRASRERTSTAA